MRGGGGKQIAKPRNLGPWCLRVLRLRILTVQRQINFLPPSEVSNTAQSEHLGRRQRGVRGPREELRGAQTGEPGKGRQVVSLQCCCHTFNFQKAEPSEWVADKASSVWMPQSRAKPNNSSLRTASCRETGRRAPADKEALENSPGCPHTRNLTSMPQGILSVKFQKFAPRLDIEQSRLVTERAGSEQGSACPWKALIRTVLPWE